MKSLTIEQVLTLKPNAMTLTVKKSPELIQLFMERHPWAKTLCEAIYCERMGIVDELMCEFPGCDNPRLFLTSGKCSYARGCCAEHSKKIVMQEKYGVDSPAQMQSVLDKMKATNIERHGVAAPAQSSTIRSKMRATMMERFGVEYAVHSEDIQASNRLREYDKYKDRFSSIALPLFEATDYKNCTAEYKWKCVKCDEAFFDVMFTSHRDTPKCPHCFPKGVSDPEREISDFIKSFELEVNLNSRQLIKPKEIDIHIPSLNLSIEYDGLYWHGESLGDSAHVNKTNDIEAIGGQLLHIFEDEWLNKKEIVKSILCAKMGKLQHRIYARQCSIVNVSAEDAKSFFNANHIQGAVPAQITYGLEFEGSLIACMSFGKSRYNKNIQWELLRFATALNHHCVGGSSRLFKHFVKTNSPESILSYADRRYSKGNMYSSLGFEFTHVSPPSYSYFRNGYFKRESRIKFQKHKLADILPSFDSSMTEWENMKANGYNRIFDCGALVYEWIA